MTPSKFLILNLFAIAGLCILQAMPFTGIFLMLFGAAALTGLLVNVFLISLFVLSLSAKLPRLLAVIPVLFYATYYVVFFQQGRAIADLEKKVNASTIDKIFDFDPAKQSLVLDPPDGRFVDMHDIPAVFSVKLSTHRMYETLLAPIEACANVHDECNTARSSETRIFGRELCRIGMPNMPQGQRIFVSERTSSTDSERRYGISRSTLEVVIDGKSLASIEKFKVARLPALPIMVVGCGLIDNPSSWRCFADFARKNEFHQKVQLSADQNASNDPIGMLLGIKKRTNEEMASFKGYDVNADALVKAHVPVPTDHRCKRNRRQE